MPSNAEIMASVRALLDNARAALAQGKLAESLAFSDKGRAILAKLTHKDNP